MSPDHNGAYLYSNAAVVTASCAQLQLQDVKSCGLLTPCGTVLRVAAQRRHGRNAFGPVRSALRADASFAAL